MSTKINVRSPFYLNLTEPSVPEPLFTCEIANIQNLAIDQQGQIIDPVLDYGTVLSITSTDPDFSNDKFAVETTATTRLLTVRIAIPSGFNNSEDGYIDCDKSITQPAYISGTTCSGGPTTNGSISAQSLAVDGDSVTINLSSYFTQGSSAIAGYTVYNPNKSLVSATVTGNNLTIVSSSIGGSTTLQVSAYDNDSNTCTATQSIGVTVSSPSTAFDCTIANLTGGSISQSGTIVKPTSVASVGTIKSSSGGSAITSYSANTTGSDRSVTLYFDLTIPAGYSNSGTLECSKTFTQPAANPEFTCELANLSGQQISSKGSVLKGNNSLGTISGWSPLSFDTVSVDTSRSVTFYVTPPASGYSNSGGSDISCSKTITQPAAAALCGSNSFYLAAPKTSEGGYCDSTYSVRTAVTCTGSSVTTALGERVCRNNAPFDGSNFYYAVSSTSGVTIGKGTGKFYAWQIDSNGIIMDIVLCDCPTDGSDSGLGFSVKL